MRLIDADAFYEKMNDLSKYHEGVYNGAINDCMNLLDNEPTAYDVEAVVADIVAIHNQTCTEEIDCKGWNCDECFEMRVREIVRGKE